MRAAQLSLVIASTFFIALSNMAQDRRTVLEPSLPESCETLRARLSVSNGNLPEDDEKHSDTTRLQSALSHCAKGHAVLLAADAGHNAFLSGPFRIPANVTLIVQKGVTLFASSDAALYAVRPGSCGVVNQDSNGCRPFIAMDHAAHAGIMGEGSIDGRGGAAILGKDVSWWELAAQARNTGRQQVPRLIEINSSDDVTFYQITLRNSANFHLVYRGGHGFTVWGVRIDTPKTARNTDGIDPSGASDVTVTRSYIRTGDDNIAIKGSAGGVQHMSVLDNHFYYGHGMSIGSETYDGVSDLLVKNLTLDGTDSGIRIKSNITRGGLVDRATYENVCIRNVKNPIFLDTAYNNPGPRQDRFPEYRNITLRHVGISGGGHIQITGLDGKHRTRITLDDVQLEQPGKYAFSAAHASITYGPGPVSFRFSGEDVDSKADATASTATARSCSDAFVPFPVN